MQEKEVSVRSVVAGVLWIVGSGLVLASIFTREGLGHVGLAFIAAGVVFHLHGLFNRLQSDLKNAFDLGRDYEREVSDRVRSLH